MADLTVSANIDTLMQSADFAAAKTSQGLGTGDSPQFAGVNIGAATDTTITRVSAGVIAVEGVAVPLQGGPMSATTLGTTGIVTAAGATVNTAVSVATSGAVNIDFSKRLSTQALVGATTWTYTGSPATNQSTEVRVSADSTARVVTLPANTFEPGKSSATASFTVPASTTLDIQLIYDGTNTFIFGLPPTVTGTGSTYVLQTSPTLITPILGTPTSVTLTNGTGLPVSTGVSGLGTGVATALAINVGTAGAPVVLNGAGGTPSSLTLTNATGLLVAGGGTGVATLTAYAPIFGGTTGTGAVQSGTVGTAGQVLTSNGAGALPTFQSASGGGGTKTIAILTPQTNEPPTTNYATFDVRNSHPLLNFDTTTQESAVWSYRVPEAAVLTSGFIIYVQWCAATATSGTIGWDVAFERIVAGGLDIGSDSFGTAQTITAATVSGTSGITSTTSVTISQANLPSSLAAGDMYRVRIRRDVANDTATGDAQLLQVEIRTAN